MPATEEKQTKCGELELRGQLVQVPGGVGLGGQDALELLGVERLDQAVVERRRRCGSPRPAGARRGSRPSSSSSCVAIGDVAGGDRRPAAPSSSSSFAQLRAPGASSPRAADQQQVPGAVGARPGGGRPSAPRPPVAPVIRTVRSGSKGVGLGSRLAGAGARRGTQAARPRAGRAGALVDGQRAQRMRRLGGLAAVGVDQQEAAGVLGLRRSATRPQSAAAAGSGDSPSSAATAPLGEEARRAPGRPRRARHWMRARTSRAERRVAAAPGSSSGSSEARTRSAGRAVGAGARAAGSPAPAAGRRAARASRLGLQLGGIDRARASDSIDGNGAPSASAIVRPRRSRRRCSEAHPQRRRPRAVQRTPLQAKGNRSSSPCSAASSAPGAGRRRAAPGGREAPASGACSSAQRDLGEELLAPAPGGAQALEGGAVFEAGPARRS